MGTWGRPAAAIASAVLIVACNDAAGNTDGPAAPPAETAAPAAPATGKVELLQVPIKWCAVEGSPAAVDPGGRGETNTDELLWRRHERASDNIWIPQAQITFRSAFALGVRTSSTTNFPIIPDPVPDGPGMLGDLEVTFFNEELSAAVATCEARWADIEAMAGTSIEGIPVVNARNLVGSNGGNAPVAGVAQYPMRCRPGDADMQALCADPTTFPSWAPGAWVVIPDNQIRRFDATENVLAHELGHALMLGHGNGIDDDADSMIDECCDRDEADDEPFTLMCATCVGATMLTSHQRTFSRAIALETTGAVIDPPAELIPGNAVGDSRPDGLGDADRDDGDLLRVAITRSRTSGNVAVAVDLAPATASDARLDAVIAIDLDGRQETGGSPEDLGYGTEQIETADLIAVAATSGDDEAQVFRWSGNDWAESTVRALRGETTSSDGATTGTRVAIQLGADVEVEAVVGFDAQVVDEGGAVVDRVDLTDVNTWFVSPPDYPVCGVSPPDVEPGAALAVEAIGLVPDGAAKVFLGDELIGTGDTDADGAVTIEANVPDDARSGPRLVTVGTEGSALTADCGVTVMGS